MKRTIEIYNLKDIPSVIKTEEDVEKVFYFYHAGSLSRDSIEIVLEHENAEIELNGAILAKNKDEITLNTVTKHKVGNNNARVNINAVLYDQAKLDFTGMIEIHKNAQLADSYLQQDNLVVSPNAVCNSSPQLEIQADDVKASHGATVGSFDPIQLFYMRSRGLDEDQSKNLIAEGFLAKVYGNDLNKVQKQLSIASFI